MSNHTGGYAAATIRQRSHGSVVIVEIRIASEDAVVRAEIPVEPGVELVLVNSNFELVGVNFALFTKRINERLEKGFSG